MEIDLIRQSTEAQRYPGLLALCLAVQDGAITREDANVARLIGEAPLKQGLEVRDLFTRYVEHGEIGAAQFLLRKYGDLPTDRILRESTGFGKKIAAALIEVYDGIVQLEGAAVEEAGSLRRQLVDIERDQILKLFRPGPALHRIQALSGEVESCLERRRAAILAELRSLASNGRTNADVEAATRKVEELVNIPEGLAGAARLLGVAQRASVGPLSPDDLHLLHSAIKEGARVVRSWMEVKAVIADATSPARLAEALAGWQATGRLRFPSDFDRDRLRDLLVALVPDRNGSIQLERVEELLRGFLSVSLGRPANLRRIYGFGYPLGIDGPRHAAFGGAERKLVLGVPLRGTDPSAMSQLLKEIGGTDPGSPLPILVYPGVSDPARALPVQLGLAQQELLYIDCVDLIRLAELPVTRRPLALQQVLLPRMPSLASRTYQTGGPVASELFRGRQRVMDELTKPRGKTVLFSGRMMGKSSVLARIRDRIASTRGTGTLHHCVLVSAATGELFDPLADRLFELLPQRDAENARTEKQKFAFSPNDKPGSVHEKEVGRHRLLRTTIERITAGARLTVLVDEADKFAKLDAAKDQSLAWLLRDLENHAPDKLRVVFAGFQTLHHEVMVANGAFANWFGQCQLGPLERDEAIALVREPLADFGVQFVSEAGVNQILDFTGGYPLLIQETCARLMKRAMARRPVPPRVGDEIVSLSAGEVDAECRAESLRIRLHQVLSLNLDRYPRLKLVTYLILQSTAYRLPSAEPSADQAGNLNRPAIADVFRIDDVQRMLIGWYGDKLSEYFSETSLPGLVEELESLGLVARHADGYRFLNQTFADMIRERPDFEGELLELLQLVADRPATEARRYWSLPQEHLEKLMRSRSHALLVGLPTTLKSEIVKTLFSREQESSSLLLNDPDVTDAASVAELLSKHLKETRKTLSLGDLCVKAKLQTLVLDCPKLPLAAIAAIAVELESRAEIRLVATGDAAVARQFVERPVANFEIVSVRRLRAQDIVAWGEEPFRTKTRTTGQPRDISLFIDQKSAKALVDATGGFFPLLQRFRGYCEKNMIYASEYYPGPEHVDGFRAELAKGELLRDILLSSLNAVETGMLRDLLEFVGTQETRIDRATVEELICEKAIDDTDMGARLAALEVLVLLDFLVEQADGFVLDNGPLLQTALAQCTGNS